MTRDVLHTPCSFEPWDGIHLGLTTYIRDDAGNWSNRFDGTFFGEDADVLALFISKTKMRTLGIPYYVPQPARKQLPGTLHRGPGNPLQDGVDYLFATGATGSPMSAVTETAGELLAGAFVQVVATAKSPIVDMAGDWHVTSTGRCFIRKRGTVMAFLPAEMPTPEEIRRVRAAEADEPQ
ncbi:hypothetical protein [Streptomyces virginiae]|uniref:hypothetical protein n=1 Tax=Streptomyces virginiae TaxID=1961 RepID=UPI0036634324